MQQKAELLQAPGATAKAVVPGTFLFADVRGFTEMTASLGAPESLMRMTKFYHLVDAAVSQQKGIVDNHIGDSVMVHFGIMDDQANPADRAIATALAIQFKIASSQLASATSSFSVGIGIATGPVAIGIIGKNQKRKTICIGDAVNIASRLTGIAQRGQVLLDKSTYAEASQKNTLSKLRPINIRGKKERIDVYEAHASKGHLIKNYNTNSKGVDNYDK